MSERGADEKPKTKVEILLNCPAYEKIFKKSKANLVKKRHIPPQEIENEAHIQALTVISGRAQLGDFKNSQELGGLLPEEILLIAEQATKIFIPSRKE